MRLTVNGTPHLIYFSYERQTDRGDRGETFCYLDPSPSRIFGLLLPSGSAVCHPNEAFCKARGRKESLTRALKKKGYHKTFRGAFWAAYFKQDKRARQ